MSFTWVLKLNQKWYQKWNQNRFKIGTAQKIPLVPTKLTQKMTPKTGSRSEPNQTQCVTKIFSTSAGWNLFSLDQLDGSERPDRKKTSLHKHGRDLCSLRISWTKRKCGTTTTHGTSAARKLHRKSILVDPPGQCYILCFHRIGDGCAI